MRIFNKLEIIFQLPLPIMRNFIANLDKILGICKDFAGNSVNELEDVHQLFTTIIFSKNRLSVYFLLPKETLFLGKQNGGY